MDFTGDCSNGELREAVLLRLESDPEIGARDIGVQTDDGVAILTGFVHSYAEKAAAGKAAKSVYGVKALANDIDVKPMTPTGSQ
jgi:osmotically-inducible protein OsmY